jgi:hypothetical protein
MDFFAIAGGHQHGVYRMELEQNLQSQLAQHFTEQAGSIIDENLVAVPFERENFHPDETEVLEISPFDLPEHIYEPTANPVGWPTLPADEDILSRIYCVFGYDQSADRIIFQVIQRTQRITPTAWSIILSGNTFTKLQSPGLILGSSCHAVYDAGSLKFRSMWWLKQIIDISSYYREATDGDIDALAVLDSIHVENLEALKETSGQWVRTRVAYILDSGVLNNFTPNQLKSKAAEFNVDIDIVNEDNEPKLVLPENKKALRSVLKFLEEEYYAGPITGAAYEANSKRRIDNG